MGTNGFPAPSGPIPPPAFALAIGEVRDRNQVYFSSVGLQLMQQIWAAIQGNGGLIDIAGIPAPPNANQAAFAGFAQLANKAKLALKITSRDFSASGDVTAPATPFDDTANLDLVLTLTTAQGAVHTWALTQTFTVAPVFTDQPGTQQATGIAHVYTVATLPVGVPGQRAYVSDATAPAFGVALVGGGAVGVPCYRDGAGWKAG